MAQGFAPTRTKAPRAKYPAQLPGESKRAYNAFCKFFDSEKAGRPIEYPTRHRQCWDGWRDRNHWPLRVMGLPLPPIETFTPPEGAPPQIDEERADQYEAFVYFWRAVQTRDRFPLESAQTVYRTATGKPGNLTQWKDKHQWNARCGIAPAIPTLTKSAEKRSKVEAAAEHQKAVKGKEKQTQTQTTRDLLTLAQSQQSSIKRQLQQAIDYLDGDLQAIAALMDCPIGMPLGPIVLADDCPVVLPEPSIAASRLLRGMCDREA
jgi:hypothetical protein